jgi:hypothetical protein
VVSFEIFLQNFAESSPDRSKAVRAILDPILSTSGIELTTADGSADVYGLEDDPVDGLMFSKVAGEAVWDVIYAVAVAGDWVVMPVGCPVCVISDEQIALLPEGLGDPAPTRVSSGAGILDAIRSA